MSPPPYADDELELSDYLRILRRRWPWVLLPLVAVTALATAVSLGRPPVYCSTAQVLLADSEAQVAIQGDANVSGARRDLANEINIAHSDSVRQEVIGRLGLDPDVEVEGDEDSDVLWFRACGPTASEAASYANTAAEVYVATKQEQATASIGSAVEGFQVRLVDLREDRQELRRPLDEAEDRLIDADPEEVALLQAQVERLRADLEVELALIDSKIESIANAITELELDQELAGTGTARLIQIAAPPTEPANAPLSRNLSLAVVVGLILGAAAALLVENLDRSIKSADDIDGVPVLGTIPRPDRELASSDLALATMNHTGSPVADGYQKVRTAIEFALLGRRTTSLLITSAEEADGKTTTSINLAWAMSAVDHRVVLADVDFRRPRIHEVFGCPPEPGLSDRLFHDTPLSHLALRVDDHRANIVIIPAGTTPPSPGDLVASPPFADLLRELEGEADLVVLDSPPVLPVSDSLSIARQVDAVIVVARAGKTSKQKLASTVENLTAVGAEVLGVCLVGTKAEAPRYDYNRNTSRDRGRSDRGRPTRRGSKRSRSRRQGPPPIDLTDGGRVRRPSRRRSGSRVPG